MLDMLSGRKTHLVAVAMVLFAVLGLVTGQLEQAEAVRLILEGSGLSALRAGVAKRY